MSNIEIVDDFINELQDFELNKETIEVTNAWKDILSELKELNKTNNDLRLLYRRTAKKLQENGKEELADYLLAQIDALRTFSIDDDIDYYKEYYKQKSRIKELEQENYLQRKQIMSAYDKGWIPVQKIKDKIEEIEKEYNEIISEYGNIDTDVIINVPDKNVRKYLDELVIKILVLQELLEDK